MTDPVRQMAGFAASRILTRPDLSRRKEFPQDLWKEMGAAGLLDPESMAEGKGPDCLALTRTARAMAENGANLGLTLSWIIHHLTAGFLLRPHVDKASGRFERLWSDLRGGRATVCFAVSEPDGGGHPKFLSTRAKREGDAFVLTGEKTYLTNGPIARAFVVVAVTGRSGGKKSFSAFLVDREAPGLEVSSPMDLPFLNPSPHGSICMENCRVDAAAMLRQEGRAYEEFVLRFRQLEDALMTGAVTGAMAFLLARTARALGQDLGSGLARDLGRLCAMARAARVLSSDVALAAGDKNGGLEGVHLFFRELADGWLQDLKDFVSRAGITLNAPGSVLVRDLEAASNLGKTVFGLKLQKLGAKLVRESLRDR